MPRYAFTAEKRVLFAQTIIVEAESEAHAIPKAFDLAEDHPERFEQTDVESGIELTAEGEV